MAIDEESTPNLEVVLQLLGVPRPKRSSRPVVANVVVDSAIEVPPRRSMAICSPLMYRWSKMRLTNPPFVQ